VAQLEAMQSHKEDTSCGFEEEGQAEHEMTPRGADEEAGVELTAKSAAANTV
jgi:hypothetical protein